MTQRILFFGMEGVFSRAPLLGLIESHHSVCAVVVPRPEQLQPAREPIRRLAPPRAPKSDAKGTFSVPLLFEPHDLNIIGMAWNAGIEVFQVSDLRDDATIQTIQRLHPTLIVVACFPMIFPNHLIAQYPCLNLHPSLLPAYRGPAPLFWIFHDGLERAGVTVHLMDEHADTGDIVAQERVALADGTRYAEAEKILSEYAAALLVNSLDAAQNHPLARTPQPHRAAPRAPNPSERDYVITSDWTARRAFNFIRGIGVGVRLQIGVMRFTANEAISYQTDESLTEPMIKWEGFWKVRFAKGVLNCTLAE